MEELKSGRKVLGVTDKNKAVRTECVHDHEYMDINDTQVEYTTVAAGNDEHY